MALQTPNLQMVALGIRGNQPPNSFQPPLVNGIHLRWSFKYELGFPWYGFYLFRRIHRPETIQCVSSLLPTELPISPDKLPYTHKSSKLETTFGTFRSNTRLLITDNFEPSGQVEFDLAGRQYLRLDLPEETPARRVELQIGLRRTIERQQECVDFKQLASGPWLNPRVEHDTQFEVQDEAGSPVAQTVVDVVHTPAGDIRGLNCGRQLHITLPVRAVHSISLTFSFRENPVFIEAFNEDGTSAGRRSLQNPNGLPETVTFRGNSIRRIVVDTYAYPEAPAHLHEICFDVDTPTDARLWVTAFSGRWPVACTFVTGQAGEIISTALECTSEDISISAIQISGGPAALVDVCIEPAFADPRNGWELVPWCSYPLSLPVTHSNYPCRRGNVPLAVDEQEALSRIWYGPQENWAGLPFADLHGALMALVEHGPQGPKMAKLTDSVVGVPIKPGSSAAKPPIMREQYPLSLVQYACLHPAIAQMVGLYWVDQQVQPRVSYDYLIVADYNGNGGLNPQRILAMIQMGFADLEAFIISNVSQDAAPPLEPPHNLRAFALPGGSIRLPDGTLQEANSVGLHWELDLVNLQQPGSDRQLTYPDLQQPRFDRQLMYHVWMAAVSNPQIAPRPQDYQPFTEDAPVLVTRPKRDVKEKPQRPVDWPPFPLHYVTRGLADGWYAFQVSGIDIFGRHSPNSAAASWRQWTPPPDPLPWYYQEPASDKMLHAFAVRLLNKIPPPMPAAIEAFALDPADPYVLKDAAYNAWWAELTRAGWYQALPEQEKRNLIGLRVRWLWTEAQRQQAPRTREFRIYYHAGPMNALLGNTVRVAASSTQSQVIVETDIPNPQPPNIPNPQPQGAFIGTRLHIGADTFRVVGSEAGTPLRLLVHRTFVHDGTVSVQTNSAEVKGTGTQWSKDLTGLRFRIEGYDADYTILKIDPPDQLTLDRNYAGPPVAGKSYTITSKLPRAKAPCTVQFPILTTAGTVGIASDSRTATGNKTDWGTEMEGMVFVLSGERTQYRIAKVYSATQLTLDRPYAGRTASEKSYSIRHPLFTDYTEPTNWPERYYVVGYNEHVKTIIPPARDQNNNFLAGRKATANGSRITLEEKPDLSTVRLGQDYLWLDGDSARPDKLYRILATDNNTKIITVDGTPRINAPPSEWIIGPRQPLRRYELFLPVPSSTLHTGLPLAPELWDPIKYAQIGVSAADDQTETKDAKAWKSWGNRYGNEGRVGAPAQIFRVWRERPTPPVPPPDAERVFATPADYHGRSFYTYRWRPSNHVKTHIFRALDDTVFQVDWFIRATRKSLDPANPKHEALFPSDWPLNRKQAVARGLNAITTEAAYTTLSSDARTILARLPGNEGPTDISGLQQQDWIVRRSRRNLSASDRQFPDEWDNLKRDTVAGKLNAMNSPSAYSTLSNDALRVLAGLPGNERAFSQLTIQPLDPDDPANANRIGPDNPSDFRVDSSLRAYVDTLDGRSSNRYFYRAAYVDSAHNPSALSLSSPPVWLPDVVPPRAPVITKVLGGDRQITLYWASNRELDLAQYRVYRTDSEEAARDLRLMDLVYTEPVSRGDPSTRSAEMSWTNVSLPGKVSLYYRLTAFDVSGNESLPSPPIIGRAYDLTPPEPPTITKIEWVRVGSNGVIYPYSAAIPQGEKWKPAVRITWTAKDPDLSSLVQFRYDPNTNFINASTWLDYGVYQFVHLNEFGFVQQEYRIKVLNRTGNVNADFKPAFIAPLS